MEKGLRLKLLAISIWSPDQLIINLIDDYSSATPRFII